MHTDISKINRAAHFILKKMNRAIYEYSMINDGDKIAVALSGGKDSFSLLKLLKYRQMFVPEKYSVCAIHVIGDSRGADIPPYNELKQWLSDNNVEYLIRKSHSSDRDIYPISCDRCARNRRQTIFEMANDLDCSKIAFGHHLDDMAETILMNIINHGKCESMPPKRDYFNSKFMIIRPMIYLSESDIARFSKLNDFPLYSFDCPLSKETERYKIKVLINNMQNEYRHVKINLIKAAFRK